MGYRNLLNTCNINGNITNATKGTKAIKKEGWKIITVWECDLKTAKVEKMLISLLKKISKFG
jgi:DNA mismatch endonuclease, patch repair protein